MNKKESVNSLILDEWEISKFPKIPKKMRKKLKIGKFIVYGTVNK